jgi:hypothetical protein
MKSRYPAVLILGIVPSLTWLVARCIRRAGGNPAILAWHPLSPMKLSGDCGRYLHWQGIRKRDGQLDPAALEQVREVCRRLAIDWVLGADYDTALLLAGCADDPAIPSCPLPRASTITTFNNKWNLTRMLDALGLPVPESAYAASAAELLATPLSFPLITKPLDLWASVGFQIHRTREELERTVAQGRLHSTYPLIVQQFVPGWDAGASFLASDGALVAHSVFRTPHRGSRVFQHDDRVRAYLDVFVEVTGYSGVGHIDLRYDPSTDSYRILELNPRFWASLLYAANAGLNYPDQLVRLAQGRAASARTAMPREVRLPFYERAMTLTNRWFASGYERLTGAVL